MQVAASLRLDEIHRYTRDRRGAELADRYITDLFAAFGKIEVHGVASRPIPAEFGGEGSCLRQAHHVVHWQRRSNEELGSMTILRARMHQWGRFREDLPW